MNSNEYVEYVRLVSYNIVYGIEYMYDAYVYAYQNVGHNTPINGHTHIVHVVRKAFRVRERARKLSLNGRTIEQISEQANGQT